jgi:hypothetical protein
MKMRPAILSPPCSPGCDQRIRQRYFDSKPGLLDELARADLAEQPDGFDFAGLRAFLDTRAERIAMRKPTKSRRVAKLLPT